VIQLYASTFATLAACMQKLDYAHLLWSAPQAAVLSRALPRFANCNCLDVSRNPFGTNGVLVLMVGIAKMPQLQTLIMKCCRGLAVAANVPKWSLNLVQMKALKLLDVRENAFDESSLHTLAQHPHVFFRIDCSAKQLKRAGFRVSQLKEMHSAAQLKDAGFSAQELKGAGFNEQELKDGGFTAQQLKGAGITARQLKDGGFDAQQLRDGGFDAQQLKDGGFDARQLKDGGFTARELKGAGFSFEGLKAAGFTLCQLGLAGFYYDFCNQEEVLICFLLFLLGILSFLSFLLPWPSGHAARRWSGQSWQQERRA